MPDTSSAPIIELRGLNKSFGAKQVLRDINLQITKGTSLAIIGSSGTGKSVLCKCMLGLIPPSSGQVLIDGKSLYSSISKTRDATMHRIGVLFQGSALFDSLTVWENVAFRLLNAQRMSKLSARPIAIDRLLQVGLSEATANLYPNELSGGMQKRVGLARAICGGSDILFFDEPTTGLDPVVGGQINRLLGRVIHETGATTITITHSMETAMQVSDSVVFVHEGRIVWSGSTRRLLNSDNPLVDAFVLGRSQPEQQEGAT